MIDLISREEVLIAIKKVVEDQRAYQPNSVCRLNDQCRYLPKVEWFTKAIEKLPTHGVRLENNERDRLLRTFLERPKNDYYF